jgi:hypothetical protein
MRDFNIQVVEKEDFRSRNKKSKTFNLIVAGGLLLFMCIISNWQSGLLFAVFFLIVQNLKSSRWDKYFISSIRLNNQQLSICYKEQGNEREVEGNINEFSVKKKFAVNRVRTVYLAIYQNDKLLLRQFEIEEWDENMFNEVINSFAEHRAPTK